jgi:glycolate oxidase FAD binding subunit
LPEIHHPVTAEELSRVLASTAASRSPIEVFGANTKRFMAGRAKEGVQISTAAMQRVVQYEPKDLTISVEAGMPFAELTRVLAQHGQMVPLEGPYSDEGTVGGVVAANISGSRRRLYGTARDLVIGMKFATLDGKLVQSGGMVVKNVAGLDMGKLMIGSFGTLAAISTVNFKLTPKPPVSRTVLFFFDELAGAMAARDAAIRSVINPAAVDLINPILAAQLGLKGFVMALLFAGSEAVIERSHREAEAFGSGRILSVEEEQKFWHSVRNLTPRHLEKFKDGSVVRVATTLEECGQALASVEGPGHAHAASGIVRAWFSRADGAETWLAASVKRGWKGVIEFSSDSVAKNSVLWPAPGGDFEIMKRVKKMFDPEGLLNSGRLYGVI